MNWLHYLVEANIYLAVFYLFYYLFLTKETHYLLNRIYLLSTCIISFIVPLIQIAWLKPAELPSTSLPQAVADNASQVLTTLVLYAYFIGVTIALVLLMVKLYRLQKLARQNPSLARDSYKLVFIEESDTAFSFFNYLFIGTNTAEPELITHHELVHIREKHSADIILLEVFRIINWFNPAIYLLQNSLKTLHEYIADEQTAFFETDPHTYATFLVNKAYGISGSSITHSFFNYNLLKKRIIMLNQRRSGNLARLKYLVAVPICAGLLCASTLAFSKTYGFITITSNNHYTAKQQTPQSQTPKAETHTYPNGVKVTDVPLPTAKGKQTPSATEEPKVETHTYPNGVKITDIPLPPAKRQKTPPPPPTPPVVVKDHKAPPPPPAPPVHGKNHKAPVVVRDVKAPPAPPAKGHKLPPPPPVPPVKTGN